MFWKKTTNSAALVGAILTIPISTVLKFLPDWTGGAFPVMPFLDRMFITFIIIAVLMIAISLLSGQKEGDHRVIAVDKSMFKVNGGFIVLSVLIVGVLIALYTVFR
jgi:solute:Na+ symporter, SSS family